MKSSLLLFLFLFLASTSSTQAQNKKITGTVQEMLSKKALGYVNIGLVDGRIGTVSDDEGEFSLTIPQNMRDSAVLRFSMIGYESKDFFWKDIKDQERILIELVASVTEIAEIMVVDCTKDTRKQKGNFIKKQPGAWMGFASEELGTEIATRIRLKKRRKSYIKTLHFWMNNEIGDSLSFRLNVYAVEEGRPSENLLEENIFLHFSTEEDLISIDLEPYHLIYEQDVFVALEYVRKVKMEEDKGIFFGSNFFGKNSYMRYASQSKWIKTPILNLGFWLEICDEK